MINKNIILFALLISIIACKNSNSQTLEANKETDPWAGISTDSIITTDSISWDEDLFIPIFIPEVVKFEAPKLDKDTIVAHVLVALCDDENQMIAGLPGNLGNGLSLSGNLYWGAGFGIRTFFRNKTDWKQLSVTANPDTNILERITFKKTTNGKTLYLIADAYRGDRMQECLTDLTSYISGTKVLKHTGSGIPPTSQANIYIFNGHNGLMEMDVPYLKDTDSSKVLAASISCVSSEYFMEHLSYSGGYPLLTTTTPMAPEAYVLEAMLTAVLAHNSDLKKVRESVATAYSKYQKCSYKAAYNLFKTNW